ncbi:hypothetical protein H5410_051987 [Solanum commersonii]|uniref:Uncharacterized protein n=1 Tax=Solanum commersonii TaxID=4109 RepID=A0A9J5X2Q4_SOLCO|nr:hypothetical protein H5410_051987 [Solanum commersonii]
MKDLSEVMNEEGWDFENLQQLLPGRIVNHIQEQLGNFVSSNLCDRTLWLLNSTCKFTVSTAWDLLRGKKRKKISSLKLFG